VGAIGFYYRDFHQVSDEEVTDLLARAAQLTCEEPTPSEHPSR
jgi:predicted phosphoribosyltransferase